MFVGSTGKIRDTNIPVPTVVKPHGWIQEEIGHPPQQSQSIPDSPHCPFLNQHTKIQKATST